MAQRMWRGRPHDAGVARRLLHRALDRLLVDMVPSK
jgi:hypothetical protein